MKRDLTRRPLGYDTPEKFFEFVRGKKIRWSGWEKGVYFRPETLDYIDRTNMGGFEFSGLGGCIKKRFSSVCGFEGNTEERYWELVDPIEDKDEPNWVIGKTYYQRDGQPVTFFGDLRDVIKYEVESPLVFVNEHGATRTRLLDGSAMNYVETSLDVLKTRPKITLEYICWIKPSDEEFVSADDLAVDIGYLDDHDLVSREEKPGFRKFKLTLEEV